MSVTALQGKSTSAGADLVRVAVRRAVLPDWINDHGWATKPNALWAVMRLTRGGRKEREFSFLHRPTGLMCPGLYSRTAKAARPVLLALESARVGATMKAGELPGEVLPSGAVRLLRSRIRTALKDADVSGLLPIPLTATFKILQPALEPEHAFPTKINWGRPN